MRLIDADALKKMKFSGGMHDDNFLVYVPFREVMGNIDNAPTVGGWISVKDRLPEDDDDVLAYLNDGTETRIAACNYSNGVWYDCVMNCIVVINNVTHWMLLPKPPKEEQDANER